LRIITPILILVLLAFALTACSSNQPILTPSIAPNTTIIEISTVGHSVEERSIECTVIRTSGSDQTNSHLHTILFIAGIHGDEPAGIPLLQRLQDELRRDPSLLLGRTIVLLPNINPDGVASNQRTNINGVDLNRNFQSKNWSRTESLRHGNTPLSEPESRIIVQIIEQYNPDRIITIHQPIACIDYDGPESARQLAEQMSASIDHRLPVRKLGSRPGSLGSYAGNDMHIPTITVELPRNTHRLTESELWERYGEMLLTAIGHSFTS